MLSLLGRPTAQSSTYSEETKTGSTIIGSSDKAVDGSTDTEFQQGSCTHTLPDENIPWWAVDLLGLVTVFSVDLTNRIEGSPCK